MYLKGQKYILISITEVYQPGGYELEFLAISVWVWVSLISRMEKLKFKV